MHFITRIFLPLLAYIIINMVTTSAVRADDLQSAYQKEFAYLEEQKHNLVTRLAEFKKSSVSEKKTLSAQVDRLSQEYRELQNKSENLNNLVFESERTLETAKDNKDIFSSTFEQAEETLKSYDVNAAIADDTASNTKVGILFGHAFDVMERVRSTRKEKGSFFDNSGQLVEGELLHLGQIASYGMSDSARGIVVPAGEGMFKLWQKPEVSVTDNLFAGIEQLQLSIFLYEDRFNAVNAGTDKGMLDYISSGGLVAWIIILLGVVGIVLILIRASFLRYASSASEKILSGIKSYVSKKDIAGALDYCKSYKGSTSRIVSSTLRNLERDRDHLEDIVAESILHESTVLNRFGAIIIVIAAVAPLLGLLGTVTGMISTFDIITEFGTGDPKLLSGGISVALVTTQLGLVVAIPTLIIGNLLSGWSNRIKDDMEKAALNVINIYDAPQLAR